MGDPSELLKALRGEKAEQSEFEQVVLEHFGHASQLSNEEISYGPSQGGSALKLIYDENGLLVGAQSGPDLKIDDIETLCRKVEEQLLTPGPIKVRRRILFTALPTRGWFRYRDQFQIVPMPEDAPQLKVVTGDHPFFLEFKFPSSSNFTVSHQRQERIGRELELICSALFSWRVWSIGPQVQFHWSIELKEGETQPRSKFLQEGYTWPGMRSEIDDFSEINKLSPLAALDSQAYYTLRGISVGQTLDIPADLPILLDAVSKLSRRDRDRFLRASYWFQHANSVFPLSKSASFVALVSAVEALSSGSQGSKRCKECGQSIGPGPTKLFADFVEAHLPDTSIPESERKRFYTLRSALSHGGKLLLGDHSLWGFTPKSLGEDTDMRALWQIVRTIFHNWLIRRNAAPAPQ